MNNLKRNFISIFLFLGGLLFTTSSMCMDPCDGTLVGDLIGKVKTTANLCARKNLESIKGLNEAQHVVETIERNSEAYESVKLLNKLEYKELAFIAAKRLVETFENSPDARTNLELLKELGYNELWLEAGERMIGAAESNLAARTNARFLQKEFAFLGLSSQAAHKVVSTIGNTSEAKKSIHLLDELGFHKLSEQARERSEKYRKKLFIETELIKSIKYLAEVGSERMRGASEDIFAKKLDNFEFNGWASRTRMISNYIGNILLAVKKDDLTNYFRGINSNPLEELTRLENSLRKETISTLVGLTHCFMVLGNTDAAVLTYNVLVLHPDSPYIEEVLDSEFPEFKRLSYLEKAFQPVFKIMERMNFFIASHKDDEKDNSAIIDLAITKIYQEFQTRGDRYKTSC